MGNCIRKPIVVYESILEECYDLLNQENLSEESGGKKKRMKNQHESSGNGKNSNLENILMQECTEAIKDKANKSFNEFNALDVNKLQNQVRLSANTLSDHIQDTHVRLIDSVNYLKDKLKSDKTSYPIEWITLEILQVLVVNLKNYTQKHISLKEAEPEDSNAVSKIDNLTEEIDNNNHPKNAENMYQPSVAGSKTEFAEQQQQITFFSDNFIRFEMDFLEIALYILSEKCNPFYRASRGMFLGILLKFSIIHKDHYTSEKIFKLTDELETDIQHLVREILAANSATLDADKLLTLQQLMAAYTATLSKIKTEQNVFRSSNQLHFFHFLLQCIIDFNKRFRLANHNEPEPAVQEISPFSSNEQADHGALLLKETQSLSQKPENEISPECIKIIRVFSRRSFILKNYNDLLSNLFTFFDSAKWDEDLMIEKIINETISVACEESVQLNYKVYLLEEIIEYLLLTPSSSSGNVSVPTMLLHANTLNTQALAAAENKPTINKGSPRERVTSADASSAMIPSSLVNFADKKVKISALKLFDSLVEQKDQEIPMLMHSTSKIVKCFLENLREFAAVSEVKRELQESFVHYALEFAPDSSSLLSLLTALSSDIADQFGSSSLTKAPFGEINTPRSNNNNNNHSVSGFKVNQSEEESLPQMQHEQSSEKQQNEPENDNNTNEVALKYILEGLTLMESTIDCASSNFVASPIITDELIINLLFLSNLEKAALISFEIITELLLLKLRSVYAEQAGTPAKIAGTFDFNANPLPYLSSNPNPSYENSSSTFLEISENSLLHIFYQGLKSIMFLHVEEDTETLCNAVIIVEYTNEIIQEIIKRNNLLQIRSVFAYLAKLIKETIAFENSHSQQKVSGSHTPKKELYSSVLLTSHAQPKNPVCFNILELAIIELLEIMEPVLGIPEDQGKIKVDSAELTALMKAYLEIFVLHNKKTVSNRKKNDSPKFERKNMQAAGDGENEQDIISEEQENPLSEIDGKFTKLSDDFLGTPYLQNKAFHDHHLLDLILKEAKTQGFSSDENFDFDELTAEFARNFTSAVGDIDFENFNHDDESQFASNYQPQRDSRIRNSAINPFMVYNSAESIGEIEIEDEQFGNILGMIERRDLEVPNLFKEDTTAEISREEENESEKEQIIEMHDVHISIS